MFFFFCTGGSSAATMAVSVVSIDEVTAAVCHQLTLIEYVLQLCEPWAFDYTAKKRVRETHPLLRQSGALDVFDGAQFPRQTISRLERHRSLLLLGQLLQYGLVIPQVDLSPDDQARHARAVMVNFREPFLLDVFERGRAGDAEAYEEDVGLRVRQGSESIVILLTGGIEETEGIRVVADHDGDGVIVKDGRNVFGGELRECEL